MKNPPIHIANTASTDSKQELARLCLASRLYTPGGYMKHQYEMMRDNRISARYRRILGCYYHGKLVGAIVGVDKYIMVYVIPKFRRCGVGTFLINTYARKYRVKRSNLEALTGSKGSGHFYFANSVRRANSTLQFVEAFGFRVILPLKHQPPRGKAHGAR